MWSETPVTDRCPMSASCRCHFLETDAANRFSERGRNRRLRRVPQAFEASRRLIAPRAVRLARQVVIPGALRVGIATQSLETDRAVEVRLDGGRVTADRGV